MVSICALYSDKIPYVVSVLQFLFLLIFVIFRPPLFLITHAVDLESIIIPVTMTRHVFEHPPYVHSTFEELPLTSSSEAGLVDAMVLPTIIYQVDLEHY